MTAFMDLTGRRFGRWTVERLWGNEPRRRHWRCLCDCGNVGRVLGDNLKSGKSLSCDCLRVEICTKHGMINHEAYSSWKAARNRCSNPNLEDYHNYGGRGITFCARWDDFNLFWKDMGPTWAEGLSIDRIDTDGNYEPENCKWSTPLEQAANRRNNVIIDTPQGRMTVTDAARVFEIKRVTLNARVRSGRTGADLFEKPRHHSFWHDETN